MSEWKIRIHPDFVKDLDKLDRKVLQIFAGKKEKIKANPLRLKHLRGGENCYREEITTNIHLVYYVEGHTIWMLTIGRHDAAYRRYLQRFRKLRQKLI